MFSKVSNILIAPSNNYTNSNITRHRLSNQLNCDTVSFSGNKKVNNTKTELSERGKEASSVAKKLMKIERSNALNIKSIEETLNEKSPVPITVLPISQCPVRTGPEIVAHMLPMYNYDLELAMANIYVDTNAQTAKQAGDLIANIGHEYTHVLQRAEDKSYFGLKEYTEDIDIIQNIIRTSQEIYNGINSSIGQNLLSSNEFVRNRLSGISLPYAKQKSLGLKGLSIKDTIGTFADMKMKKNPELYNRTTQKIPEDKLTSIITDCIVKIAETEIEAYEVTLSTLAQWGKYDPVVKVARETAMNANKMIIEEIKS